VDVLTDEQISERLAEVPGWAQQGDSIVHTETLADFKAAILYVGAVAYLAEAASHHPDITIEWNKVTFTLSTHSAGGLTDNDFALAKQIGGLTGSAG
jgi:4a-hydroxytetrahydrobiopterin dehydratase